MTIKEVEKLVGITSANIRFYEKEGLFTPIRNTSNNYREYTEKDVEDLKKIKILRMLGVSLSDIKSVITEKEELGIIIQRRIDEIKLEAEHLEELEKVCHAIVEKRISFATLDGELIDEKKNFWKDRLVYYMQQDITIEWVSPKQMNRTVGGMLAYMFFVNALLAVVFGNLFQTMGAFWVWMLIAVSIFGLLATAWTAKRYVQILTFQLITLLQAPAAVVVLGGFLKEGSEMSSRYVGVVMMLLGLFVLILLGIYHLNESFFDKKRYGMPVVLIYAVVSGFIGGLLTGSYIGIGIAVFVVAIYISIRWSEININGTKRYNKYYAVSSASRMANLLAQMHNGQYVGMEEGYGRYKK